jgi:hypothetical protein
MTSRVARRGWADLRIKPLETAKHLWEKSHPLSDTLSSDLINDETPDSSNGARE